MARQYAPLRMSGMFVAPADPVRRRRTAPDIARFNSLPALGKSPIAGASATLRFLPGWRCDQENHGNWRSPYSYGLRML